MLRRFCLTIYLIYIANGIFLQCQVSALNIEKECQPATIDGDCSVCGKCLPGLKCNEAKKCKIDTGTCDSYQWTNDKWKPKCEEDGTFSPLQCKGEYSNGRCFCFNPTGSRIFGWSWWDSERDMTKNKCACSRRQYELSRVRKDVSLHCTEDGNYEELQCDDGLCWCAEPYTGKPTQRVYPESLMTYLPCYRKKDIGSQYLRRCESKSVARAKILKKIDYHGHKYFDLDDALCDTDGSYSNYRIDRNMVWCTWKDGSKIEIYQATVSNLWSIDCNCARDTRIYAEANLEFRLMCDTNGNYLPLQSNNGHPFCVDKDGFATTDLGEIGQALSCK